MASSGSNILPYGIIGFFAGLYLFFSSLLSLKRKMLIENTPTSKIRSLAMGLVEVYGEVVPAQGKILKSPFSNSDCVYCRYTVEEYRSSGKSHYWAVVDSGEHGAYFFLRDDTGVVLVNPTGAEVDIPMDFEYDSSLGKDPPERVKLFLKSAGIGFEGLFGINKTMRYREYLIAPRDKLYVMGTAGDNPFVEDATAVQGVADIMIRRGGHEKIYYIADKPEKRVLDGLKWTVAGGIYGGAALSVACLFIILKYLNLI